MSDEPFKPGDVWCPEHGCIPAVCPDGCASDAKFDSIEDDRREFERRMP